MESLYELYGRCRGVSTDSRAVGERCMFFALRGESFNGNRYALAALEKGAAYAVVDDVEAVRESIEGCGLRYEDCRERLVECDDTLFALQLLAAEHRKRLGIPVLAITGSNGKTTTKELVSRVLAKRYNVSTTKGNLNNHIGVPLTLLAMDSTTEFGVVEMGASACGEIALLSAIAQPNFGIITNIGRAHLEGFGGADGVKRGKGELCDYLNQHEGVFFYIAESEALTDLVKTHCRMESIAFDSSVAEGIKSHLEGDYNRYNIAAAVTIGEYFDVDRQSIVDAIGSYQPDNNRSQRMDTEHNSLIVDCYNANPSSVAAALDNFGSIVGVVRDKCVILGDMLELGEYSAQEHQSVIRQLLELGLTDAMLVGNNFVDAVGVLRNELQLPESVQSFASRDELAEYLSANPLCERFILLKGSRGIGLEKLIAQL